MTLPLVTRSISDQLYAYQLSSAYKVPWVYEPSYALAREPDIWEIVRNDAGVLSAMQRRNQSIVRPWRIEPNPHCGSMNDTKTKVIAEKSKQLAAICHEGLSFIQRFNARRRRIAEAFFLGRTYGAILWERKYFSLDATQPMDWWIPVGIKDIDRRRFRWVTEFGTHNERRDIRLDYYSTKSNLWEKVTPQMRRNIIEYIYDDTEDRLGYGRGVLEAIYFAHYFKTGTFKKVTEGIDRYANGIWIGKLDSLRNANTDKTNEELVRAMEDVFKKMRSEHAAVLGENDEIEIKEPSGKGMDISMNFIRYLDEQIERLCNGSVRPSGHSVDGTGSKAAASQESETSEAFYQDDREDLDSILDRDLLGAFLFHNNQNLAKLELDVPFNAKRPKFSSEQIKRQDPTTRLSNLEQIRQMGLPLLASEVYEAGEVTAPGPDDDVVAGMVQNEFDLGLGELDASANKSPSKDGLADPPEQAEHKKVPKPEGEGAGAVKQPLWSRKQGHDSITPGD